MAEIGDELVKKAEQPDCPFPYIEGSKAQGYNWIKIEDESSRNRVYKYTNGGELTIKGVVWICVKSGPKGDSHRLYLDDNKCVYVPPGWVAILWEGKFQF